MRPRTLKSAAEHGDLEAVIYHLSNGADINGTTAAGHFALGDAIINDHPHIVECLIAHGADVNLESAFGWTPLYIAAWKNRPECAAMLLQARARKNTKTTEGWYSPPSYTPLHIAAERGHLAIVKLLIRAGARINARTGTRKTAFDLAKANGHKSVVRFLNSQVAARSLEQNMS